MFIPLGTDRKPKRRPVVTEFLIVTNLLVYLFGVMGHYYNLYDFDRFVSAGHFDGQHIKWWQLITYQFLHDPGGVGHVAFNMLFLWVFGCAVEDRMTRTGFFSFYLMAGIFAALAHMSFSDSPIIGASGSIAGVTGAFLALFPRSRIKILFFFFIIGIYMIPSLWFIGLYFLIDVLRQTGTLFGSGQSNVAYSAHIAGYIYGFFVAFALLGFRIIKHEEFDVFYLFKHARRRAAFREAQQQSRGAVWDAPARDSRQPGSQAPRKQPELTTDEKKLAGQRSEINRLLGEHEMASAAAKYREMLPEAPNTVFTETRQMDLANQLYAEEDHTTAAIAYELLLDSYPNSSKNAEVRLILGLIYARQLNRPKRARELIEAARKKLRDASQTALADQLLAELAT